MKKTVVHSDNDENMNVGKRKYTESKVKRTRRIKSLKDYKMDPQFQATFTHVKYYKPEEGLKHPQILLDDDDWKESNNEEV